MDEHSFQKIGKETGLGIHYLRSVFKKYPQCFEHRRGPKNALLFTNNALVTWREVRKKKEEGLTIVQIGEFLESSLKTDTQTSPKLSKNNTHTQYSDEALSLMKSAFEEALNAKEETLKLKDQMIEEKQKEITEKNVRIAELEGKLKLLEAPLSEKTFKKPWWHFGF